MTEQDTSTPKPNRFAFFIDITLHTPKGFIPSFVEENEPGHWPMIGRGELAEPWYWGHDIATAKRICDEANAKLGLTPAEANDIVISSMAASNREIAHQEDLATRLDRLRQGLPQEVQESFWDRGDGHEPSARK